MKILAIESSCDETAAALVEIKGGTVVAHSNVIASQAKLHAKYGGVVPEVAARKHVEAILPVIAEALSNHEYTNAYKYTNALEILKTKPKIDAIAVTAGPGLVTSLLVGAETARTLSYIWGKPLVAVNHLEGHVYSSLLPDKKIMKKSAFPMLALIVSGGHTELVLMNDHAHYKIIGETRDDAVGEAFDKVAKMLALGYPGGPEVSKQAVLSNGDVSSLGFPRPMINSGDFDFSFAGLKTAVLYAIQKMKPAEIKKRTPEICAEFQRAAVETLVAKTIAAAKKFKVKTILLGGGVAANKQLREQLGVAASSLVASPRYLVPSLEFTGDNAAMIGVAAYFKIKKKQFTPWKSLDVDANWTIGQKQAKR